jgi:hypothetical protein
MNGVGSPQELERAQNGMCHEVVLRPLDQLLHRASPRDQGEHSMKTKEIPREQWTSFLDGFSRKHENWSISVDILSPDLGPQTEIRQVALFRK